MTQSTLLRDWCPPELIVPEFVWHGFQSVESYYFGLYHYVAKYPHALEGLMWWFDEDGVCEDWRLME